MEKRISPGTLIERSVCMEPDCMNSAERAHQVPCSMDAQACRRPTGSMLRMTMNIEPEFRAQKESFSGIRLENNILFPRAIALEESVG